jgi:uncharacterized membrane protein YjfL (UPF0719 family)
VDVPLRAVFQGAAALKEDRRRNFMFIGTLSLGLVYLIAAFALFILGKYIFDLSYRFNLKQELVEHDNVAMAIAFAGYLVGLALALGGTLSAPSISPMIDLIDIGLYGLIAIILLNVSVRINDWLILRRTDSRNEIIRDQNLGVGMIEAANHMAMGLILYGVVAGGGGIMEVAGFWVLGQTSLIVAAYVYERSARFDVHEAIERDNVAVGTAFAGMLLAIGNIIRFAEGQSFVSWNQNLGYFVTVVIFGLVALPITRLATDRVILPGRRLTAEIVSQEHPNVGAGVIEAAVYISMSFLIGWCFKS